MRFLRLFVCVFGVLSLALTLSSPVVAKTHPSLHKSKPPAATKRVTAHPSKRPEASKHVTAHAKSKSGHQVTLAKVHRRDAVVRPSAKVAMKRGRSRVEPQLAEEADFDSAGNPLLRSSAFYVQDVRTGQVLLEKNSNSVVPIASITKLMTAMIVLDAHLPLGEVLEVSDDDVDRLKGTSSRLVVGTRMAREDFMRLALMSSENRAASALSRNYPGGQKAFVNAMNAKAQLLGMSDTRFYDGSGLNHGNVSSARDLATLVSNASHYPLIREFTTTAEYTAELYGGRAHTFHNTNALVKSPEWQIEVSKTGFINESGKCLVMQAWMANKPLAIVLLDSWGRFTRLADANRIRRWLEEVLPRGAKVAGAPNGSRSLN